MSAVLRVFAAPCTRQNGHETAHGLLEYAVRRATGAPPPPLARQEGGKPWFPGGGPEFSLTHTRTAAACALSDGPVGLDAETVRPVHPGTAARILGPEALAWLASQPDRDAGLLTLWTMKEAWVKLTGQGLRWRPEDVVLTWRGGAPTVAGETACFRTWTAGGVIFTVCTRRQEAPEWHLLPHVPG